MIDEYTERTKDDKKSGIIAAFYSAYFSRVEKLSGTVLQDVLDGIDKGNEEEMSDEGMLAVVKRLAEAGGD